LFEQVPFVHDLNENESVAKCGINLLINQPDYAMPYALTIFKTCLFAVIEKESYTLSED